MTRTLLWHIFPQTTLSLHVFANEAVHLVISILICVNPTIAVSISPCCKRILPFCELYKPKRLSLFPLHVGYVYPKCQHQHHHTFTMMLATQFSLKTMKFTWKWVAALFWSDYHCFQWKTVLLASLQRCRSTVAETWRKRALNTSHYSERDKVSLTNWN